MTPAETAQLTFRDATLDDVAFVARLWNECYPDDPYDEEAKRHKWMKRSPEWVIHRYIALLRDEPAGWCAASHQHWHLLTQRMARLEVEVLPASHSPEIFASALEHAENVARQEGAEILTCWSYEHIEWRMQLLPQLGYSQYKVEEIRELDLQANRENLLRLRDESRTRMAEQGIRLTTLAALDDPRKYEKLHACFVEAEQDTPHTHDFAPPSFESFMEMMRRPGLHEDRVWIALIEDRVVGETELDFPLHSDNVWTSWTGVAREARNRGVARALKLECFGQAIELGVGRVRTSNDERNAPMLRINDDLGYVKVPGLALFRKPA